MKFKKILAVVLAAVTVFGVAACGSNNAPAGDNNQAGGDNTITIWAWDENFNIRALNEAAAIFNETHPEVTVNIVNMAQDDVISSLNINLAAGTTDGLPNIVLIEDYRARNFLDSFLGEFADLSDIASPEDFAAYKSAISTVGDGFYSIPFDSGVAALFYRLDLIEAAGFTEADMQDLTWERYVEIGKAVKDATGVDMMTMDPSDLGPIRMMLQSAGSWYTDENGNVNIENNQALKDAFNTFKTVINADITRPITGWDQFVGGFNDGLVASVITGCWIAPSIRNAEDQAGNWRIASFPRMGSNPNSVNASALGGSSWYVLANVPGQDLAKQFLQETFASNVDLMNTLAKEINLVSTLNAAENAPNYAEQFDFFGGQKIFQLFAEWTGNIPSVDFGNHTYQIEDMMTEAFQRFMNGEDLDSLLREYQQQAEMAIR